jgi:hypothetical protein
LAVGGVAGGVEKKKKKKDKGAADLEQVFTLVNS